MQELDTDGNGTLSADEVAKAVGRMGTMSEEDVRALIEQHDINKDGVIDYLGEVQCRGGMRW